MSRRTLVLAALTLLAACGAPTPEEIAKATATDVQDLVKESITTARRVNTMQWYADLHASLAKANGSTPGARPEIPDASTTDDSFTDYKTLIGRIFTEANVVERPSGAVIFKVKGVDLCTPLRGSGTASQSCIDQFEKLQFAIRASGQTDLALLVGPSRIEALTVQIRTKQSISVGVNLAQAQQAIAFIDSVEKNFLNGITIAGAGALELKLQKNADLDFTWSASVLSDASVTVTDRDGIARKFSSAAKPWLSVRMESGQARVTATANVGQSGYQGLWSDVFGTTLRTPMEVSLSGATASLVAQDGQPLKVTGIGLGPSTSTLTFGGTKVFSVDLNEASGRQLDVEVTLNAQGLPVWTATPGFALKLFFGLEALKNAGQSVDPHLLRSTYTYALTGQGSAPKVELLARSATFRGGVRLLSGALSVTSDSPSDVGRSFAMGSCLTSYSGSSQNPAMDLFSSAACP